MVRQIDRITSYNTEVGYDAEALNELTTLPGSWINQHSASGSLLVEMVNAGRSPFLVDMDVRFDKESFNGGDTFRLDNLTVKRRSRDCNAFGVNNTTLYLLEVYRAMQANVMSQDVYQGTVGIWEIKQKITLALQAYDLKKVTNARRL